MVQPLQPICFFFTVFLLRRLYHLGAVETVRVQKNEGPLQPISFFVKVFLLRRLYHLGALETVGVQKIEGPLQPICFFSGFFDYAVCTT